MSDTAQIRCGLCINRNLEKESKRIYLSTINGCSTNLPIQKAHRAFCNTCEEIKCICLSTSNNNLIYSLLLIYSSYFHVMIDFQVVRADLKELMEMNLDGAPYAYTPFCDDRSEMDGFR